MKKTVYVDPIIGTVGDEQKTSFHESESLFFYDQYYKI